MPSYHLTEICPEKGRPTYMVDGKRVSKERFTDLELMADRTDTLHFRHQKRKDGTVAAYMSKWVSWEDGENGKGWRCST